MVLGWGAVLRVPARCDAGTDGWTDGRTNRKVVSRWISGAVSKGRERRGCNGSAAIGSAPRCVGARSRAGSPAVPRRAGPCLTWSAARPEAEPPRVYQRRGSRRAHSNRRRGGPAASPPAQPAPAPGAAAGGREGSGRRREQAERGRGRGAGGRLGMVLLPLWLVAAALLGARAAPGRQVSEGAGGPLPAPAPRAVPRRPPSSPLPRGPRAVPARGEEGLGWTGGSPLSAVLQTAASKQPGTGHGIPGPGWIP